MQIRGSRHQQDADRGFVLSDHSDWPALLEVVKGSGARRVGVTHGAVGPFARYLRECCGIDAFTVPSHFSNEG
jgi:putative mRNA 3-end processing factor